MIFAAPSREKKVIAEFKIDLEAHAGKAERVINFSADLWRPYRDRIRENFPTPP